MVQVGCELRDCKFHDGMYCNPSQSYIFLEKKGVLIKIDLSESKPALICSKYVVKG